MKLSIFPCVAIVMVVFILTGNVFSDEKNQIPKIAFLDKEKAADEIINDKLEPYFYQLQSMEMSAKTGSEIKGKTIEEKRKECRKRYKNAAREFTKDEKNAIKWYVEKAFAVLIKDYPQLGRIPWSFLKVSDDIEGGLPHTRDRYIVLSDSLCKQILMIQKLPLDQMAYLTIVELLIHEQLHVFQRKNEKKFDSLYKEKWGFIKAESIEGCEWLTKHHLANPDAVDCPWVLPVKEGKLKKYLWPLVVFSDGDGLKHMPRDFRMLAIELKRKDKGFEVKVDDKGKPVSRSLMSVFEFRKLFPMSQNIYHPNEASADLIAKLVTFENLIPKERIPAPTRERINKIFKPLKDWCDKNLK